MSSRIYLSIDFGSTYTKLTAIDLDKEEIISTARATTTVKTNVLTGFNMAFEELTKDLKDKLKDYEIVKKVACSSAAGGLKIIAIGLVPELTTEAAKKAALSSGGRVVKTYAFRLSPEDMEEISSLDYDILLLTGGTNGGNREYILDNARTLAENNIKKPIIIAGNEEVKEEIAEIFRTHNIEYYSSENVMPVVNKINVLPVKEVIREVFMNNIIKAKGMESIQKIVGNIIMPTPTAVMMAAEVFSQDNDDTIVIDIGGATTDVHSIGAGLPKANNIQLKGMEEPYSKRTVEGDLGMRYSALALYEATSLNKVREYLGSKDSKINIRENFEFRHENPDFVAETKDDIIFDEMMAMLCTEIAIDRHVGTLESIFSPMGTLFVQSGKDLTDVKYVIGTGGIINGKQGIYDQLTSEHGEKFPAEAAQYAIDNLQWDYKENALKKAKQYQDMMNMSTDAIRDQLVSEHGEKFTAEEAEYAIDLLSQQPDPKQYDGVILTVAHNEFCSIDFSFVRNQPTVLFDVKGILDKSLVHGRL